VIRIASLVDSSLIARKLAPVDRILCASPAYIERHGAPSEPPDLAAHDCIVYTHAVDRDWTFVDAGGRTERVRVRGRLSIDNGDAAHLLLLAGHGVALSPSFIVAADIAAGRLVPLLPGWRNPFGAAYAVWPHNRNLSPKVRAMVELLAARLGPVPPWERNG
jgi:DNA-binding transcriptional LysR family regulator